MGSAARRGHSRRILDIAGAAVAALLAFTAVPAVLVVIVGNPLAGGLGHAWRPLPHGALCFLVLAAWVAWAACCAQLLRAVVTDVRRGEVGARHGSSVLDRVAARIAFGVLAVTTLGAPLSLTVAAGASTPAGGGPSSSLTAALRASVAASPPTVSATSYLVQPGDTLWRIADDLLGDGADWTSLATLNLGRDVGAGARFVDPDRLRAGWRLRLPADARPAADEGDAAPVGHSNRAPSPGPEGHLPELIALGLGSLACAALARRAGSRRRTGIRFSDDPVLEPKPSEGALDTATLLHRFNGVPALHSFEAANCLLGLSLEGRASRPTIRAICVSDSGVTFCLASAPRRRASRRLRARQGRHRVARRSRCPRGSRPFLPVRSRRASHRRRRRGNLARPPRGGCSATPPGRSSTGAVARRTRRSRILGLVRDDPRERRPGRPRTPGRGRGRSAPGPVCPFLRRPGVASGWRGRPLCHGHHGTGCRQRPHRPGRSPGRHDPPDGPCRPTTPPVGGGGRADR